jgi:DNA-binding beta-propeller fold protein YncE
MMAPTQALYVLLATLSIGGSGRWDYITCDAKNDLLYVPRTTHVMVISPADGKLVADIDGLGETHGVALVPELNRGFVSDSAGDGSVTIFDLKSHAVLGRIAAADDADAIVYDPASLHVLVGCGDAKKVLAIDAGVDPAKGQAAAALDVGGKPEFIACDGNGTAWINVADKNEVMEFDTRQMKQIARWPTAPGTKPTSMAIDPAHHRLFVGCRGKLLVVFDTETGKIVQTLPIGKGVDATALDDGKVLVSCNDATLWIFTEGPDGQLTLLQTLTTVPGAKTLAVNPLTHTVYLPTADFTPPPADTPNAKPQPVEGTFKILVAAPTKDDAAK